MKLLELIKTGQFRRYEGPPRYNSYGLVKSETMYDFGDGIELKTYADKAYWLYVEGQCEKCFSEIDANKIRGAFAEYRATKLKAVI